MKLAPIPFDEAKRLVAVNHLRILDSKPEERFDRITRIAHYLFDIPSAFITLVDNDRVWFKSKYGCDTREEPRDVSFCGHAINNTINEDISSRLFEVLDAKQDDRFYDNSFIIEKCKARYYLGFVLQSKDYHNIGTLCISDSQQRDFSINQKKLFADLGLMAEAELNNYQVIQPSDNSNSLSQSTGERNACIDVSPNKELLREDLNNILNSLPNNLLISFTEQEKKALLNFLQEFPTER